MTTPIERTKGPLAPEDNWYDDQGCVIVTSDDRFHGYASRMMELVESLAAWGDPALWQYHLDLLREAIDYEQDYIDREKRLALRGGYETRWSNRKPFRERECLCNCATRDDCRATTTPEETPGCCYPGKATS